MAKLFRAESDFRATVATVAGALDLDPAIVEKDYWVTQALRSLAARHANEFVFKGGTSLSKGFKLIQRMSEDVDLLVLPLHGESISARKSRLKTLAVDGALDLGLDAPTGRSYSGGRARRDTLIYPAGTAKPPGPLHANEILLECGMHEGAFPPRLVRIETMLTEASPLEPAGFDDLVPFTLAALHPARTLIEKATLVHSAAADLEAGNDVDLSRVGRHFYDIHCLLADADVRRKLADRGEFDRMANQAFDISNARYRGAHPRPSGGFATSPAFVECSATSALSSSYRDAELLFFGRRYPTWKAVMELVALHADLL